MRKRADMTMEQRKEGTCAGGTGAKNEVSLQELVKAKTDAPRQCEGGAGSCRHTPDSSTVMSTGAFGQKDCERMWKQAGCFIHSNGF